MIHAECHSEDFRHAVRFDATPYFAEASINDLAALEEAEWGGNSAAGAVAGFFDGSAGYDGVTEMFASLVKRPHEVNREFMAFEYNVCTEDALSWLKESRPGLHAHFVELFPHAALSAEPEDAVQPSWDEEPDVWAEPYDREPEAHPAP